MKKLKLIFSYVICALICTSCDITDIFQKGEKIENYHVFNAFCDVIDSSEYAEYFGIQNEKTKVISSLEELNEFSYLIDNMEEGLKTEEIPNVYLELQTEKFSNEVNFETQNVYVTAKYLIHEAADFCVRSITKNGNKITQKIDVDVNSPSVAPSECCFIYVVADKDMNVESKFIRHNHYNPFAVYKPVLYLYNEEELDVEVKYQNDYLLKTSYPKYEDGWRVHINENGTLNVNDSQREYYAIFYDEYRNYEATFESGFNVSKDNAIEFLETSLDALGFTNREADEFIMFWLPILEENEHSLVYFEQTDERNEECPLSFSVTPDSVLRTIIHIKKVNEPQEIIPQELETVQRTGFSVVEWGGTTY